MRVHAVRRAGGSLDVLIDNEDPSNSYTVSLATAASRRAARRPSTPGQQRHVDHQRDAELRVVGDRGAVLAHRGAHPRQRRHRRHRAGRARPARGVRTVAPAPRATPPAPRPCPGPPPPPAPTRSPATTSTSESSNGSSTLVGTTSTTSLNLTGLTIGDELHLQRGRGGQPGQPVAALAPVTFTVPPPANSSCAVHYAVNSSWPGGFGASDHDDQQGQRRPSTRGS